MPSPPSIPLPSQGRLLRLASRWIPAGLSVEEQTRAHVFVITAAAGVLFSTVSGVVALQFGMYLSAATNLIAGVLAGVTLLQYRKIRRLPLVVNVLLASYLFTLAAGALTTRPYEMSAVSFLQLVPFAASTMLNLRATVRWLVGSLVVGLATLVAGEAGVTMGEVDPFPVVTRSLNYVFCVLVSIAFVIAFWRERQRSLERMRGADKARLAFLANVGHDIRTPMNGVVGVADVLLHEDLTPRQRELVETIRSSGGLMVSLINDLLDLSKAEAGRMVLRPAPLKLAELVSELKALWGPAAARRSLGLELSIDPRLCPVISVDGLRLRQVLNNLISNAIKFTERGQVRVRLLQVGSSRWKVEVEDSGLGISAAQLDRLFERFSQADDARVRAQQGAGLGLALSRQLCELMKGELQVTSAEHHGSTFTCEFPLDCCTPAELVEGVTTRLANGISVLVVDDNTINRLVARRLLETSACVVSEAVDGQKAIDAVASSPCDIVLMDVHMPVVDGLEATRRLRSQGYRGVIIGLSASAEPEDAARCLEAGMNAFLAKPVRADQLFSRLQQFVTDPT